MPTEPTTGPPSAELGLNWLYENVEQDYVEAIAWKNAQELLNTTI